MRLISFSFLIIFYFFLLNNITKKRFGLKADIIDLFQKHNSKSISLIELILFYIKIDKMLNSTK